MKFVQQGIGWIVKIGGLIVTAPVTWLVAGDLFSDVQIVAIRYLVQLAAVCMVEGVFLSNWLMLEFADNRTAPEIKTRYALTALGMYFGLWVLALQHGEGAAGIVFRAALGAALLGAGWDTYVLTVDHLRGKADRDIMKTAGVRRVKRRLEKHDAILQLELGSEQRQATLKAEHKATLASVQLHGDRLLDTVKREDRAERQKIAQKYALPSETNSFPYPVDDARKRATEQRELSKEDALRTLVQLLDDNPDQTKTALADSVSRARNTVYDYLDELTAMGVIAEAPTGSGYQVIRPLAAGVSSNDNGHH